MDNDLGMGGGCCQMLGELVAMLRRVVMTVTEGF